MNNEITGGMIAAMLSITVICKTIGILLLWIIAHTHGIVEYPPSFGGVLSVFIAYTLFSVEFSVRGNK